MLKWVSKDSTRRRIHARIRKRIGREGQLPRLNVYRSANHIYAQIIDDRGGKTLVSASSVDSDVKKSLKSGGNVAAAKVVGKAVAERAKTAGIGSVVFDRGGYAYHGRVKALADAAREAGLKF
ncbi:MAG: 50S ribosomal protein L18 [Acidobacteriota bacterium]|nr:50S ribosomal protein L18 [Acidobacteriota bacterium]